MATINVADIVTEYGAFYRNGGQSTADLYQVAMRDFITKDALTLRITRDTIYQASQTLIGSLVQPFQKGFTPRTGDFTFKPVEIRQYHIKVDESMYPDDIMPSWAGFLGSNDVKKTDWPLIRYYLEKHFWPKIAEDIEINEIGIGSYTAPTSGTAGAVSTSMNGLQTIINTHVADDRIRPITMGAIPTANEDFVDYIEDFSDQINKAYWRKDMVICMSESLQRRYQRGHEKKYGTRTNSSVSTGGGTVVEFTNLSVKGLTSMNKKANGTDCNRIFCTPRENAVLMMSEANPFRKLDVQAFERQVKLLTDWWMGVGFILPEIVFVNDQQ